MRTITRVFLGALLAALSARGLGHWQVVTLSLIASGGLGNWIDRVINDGHVTDFLNVGIGSLRTGVFNVADIVLMIGVVLYFPSSGKPAASNELRPV